MYIVTSVECKSSKDLNISQRLFCDITKAKIHLSDLFVRYDELYGSNEEDRNGNLNCSGMSFINVEGDTQYVLPYDVRATDGWIDNANCCITLQLREIEVEEN